MTYRMVCFALLAMCFAVVEARGGEEPGVDGRIDNRIIAHVLPDTELSAFIDAFNADHAEPPVVSIAAEPLDSLPNRKMYLLEAVLPDDPPPGFFDQLESELELNYTALVFSAEFLYENGAPEGKSGSTWVDGADISGYQNQYARQRLELDAAHERGMGGGVAIAVLDTGIDAVHPALEGRVLPNGIDLIDGDADPSEPAGGDMRGHGTFVSGLIALTAPDAKILPVRVLDPDGFGDGWLLAKGIAYAIDAGVEVINLSLGSTYDTSIVEALIAGIDDDNEPPTILFEGAVHKGIVVVGAAGNFDRADPREFPAMDDDQGLGVAALDENDVKANFSNFSDRLAISAPGDATDGPIDPETMIVSARPDGTYAGWAGTSFAVPFVSGAAAIVRGQNPHWPAGFDTYLQTKAVLQGTAVNIYPQNPEFADDEQLGAGRLDIGAAAAQSPVAPEPGDITGGPGDPSPPDGFVDVQDLLAMLEQWGETHSSADLDLNGSVDVGDLLILLANWS